MRKVVIVILMFISVSTFAQVKLGLEAGSLSSMVNVNSFEHDEIQVKSFSPLGFELGFYAGYNFKKSHFYPKLKVNYRQFSTEMDYVLELEKVRLEVEQKNIFSSIDLALSIAREFNRWEFNLGAGISFYEWSSANQNWDISFSDSTGYSGFFGNEIEKYEPQQLFYLDGGFAYSIYRDFSVYLNVYLPVLNSQRQMSASAKLTDDSGTKELYSKMNFTSYNFALGLRYSIF